MTIQASAGASPTRPFIEFSIGRELSGEQAGEIPRDDVLQYIHEMCVTLAFLASSYKNDRLADLLRAAAREAESGLPAAKREPQAVRRSPHSVAGDAQRNQMRTVILKPTGER